MVFWQVCRNRNSRVLFPCLLLFSAQVFAQESTPQDRNRPVAKAQWANQAPLIDGRLEEAAWETAPVISGFRQKEPREGQQATESTHVRILYDQSHLYIGIELLDSEPAQIRASELDLPDFLVQEQ